MSKKLQLMIFALALLGLVGGDFIGADQEAWADGAMARTWNQIASDALVNVGIPAPHGGPAHVGVNWAIVQIAVYDAVNSIDGGHFEPYVILIDAPTGALADAAVAQAAHDLLVSIVPGQQAALDAQLANSLATIPAGQAKDDGIAVGQQAAAAILANRAGDGRFGSVAYTFGPPDPGVYQPTPPSFGSPIVPYVKDIRPFTMSSGSEFRPKPPPALTSQQWADAYNEVKSLGDINSTVRTAAQSEIAVFWTENTPRQWNRAIRNYAAQLNLDLPDTARLFALTNTAMADAWIGCSDGKAAYNFWRPITAIRNGDTDGNSRTTGDPAWTPRVTTPTHQEYPANHGCVSTAVAHALKTFFHNDHNVDFSMDSTVGGTIVHHFDRFTDAGAEAGEARILGGIHYDFSVRAGQKLGKQVVNNLKDQCFFSRVDDCGEDSDEDAE